MRVYIEISTDEGTIVKQEEFEFRSTDDLAVIHDAVVDFMLAAETILS